MTKNGYTIFFLLVVVSIVSCKNKGLVYNDPIPKHDSLTIASELVNEDRVVNVWTPPIYEQSTDSFPVLYMPDGGIKEDFPHIANTIAKLIKEKSIAPIILVGIENTKRQRDLTGSTEIDGVKELAGEIGQSENFRSFIKNELMAEIDKRYRTTNKKGIIGESLAGLFVVETLELEPSTFDFYIAIDPSLWWNDQYLVKNAKSNFKNLPDQNIRFWFAGSSVQKEAPFITELSEIIELVAPKTLIWKYSDEPNEKHSTIFRATKEKALIWALND